MAKTLGVIGGMGPQATIDFLQKVLNYTKADRDQDHIHIVIDNNPKTPDRSEAILGMGESPLRALVKSAIKLQLMGADFLAMPCNTAHYFYDDIKKFVDVPFINMINEVAANIKAENRQIKKVGLLATKGLCNTGLYNNYLKRYGIETVLSNEQGIEAAADTICAIKKDINLVDPTGIQKAIEFIRSKGVKTIILGCTELPLIIDEYPKDIEYVDSTSVLAKRAVELAKEL